MGYHGTVGCPSGAWYSGGSFGRVDNQMQYFEYEFLTSHPIVLKEFVNVFVFILLWGAYTKAYFNSATRFQNFKYNLIPGIPG